MGDLWWLAGQSLTAMLGTLLFVPYLPIVRVVHIKPVMPTMAGTAGERPGPHERTAVFDIPGMPGFEWPEPLLTVRVEGETPRPQGSKRPVISKSTGRAIALDTDKGSLDRWRNAVIAAVWKIRARPRTPATGPIVVQELFVFARPKDRPKSLICWPTTRATGDNDKVQRATNDALVMAGVFADDSQVIGAHSWNVYTGHPGLPTVPGAVITVWEIPDRTSPNQFGACTLGDASC